MKTVKDILQKGLIVSCQALEDEPLHSSMIMAKMALAAKEGGAIAIRSNSGADIKAIKEEVRLPIIGIVKKVYPDSDIYITPTMKEIDEVVNGGAEIVAFDATDRFRPKAETLEDFVKQIRDKYPNLFIMADIATYEEGKRAAELGFDLVSTTLCGYTENTIGTPLPNIDLIKKLVETIDKPVIAEGGISSGSELKAALEAGAYAAVVGTAITRPREITKKFMEAIS